MANKNIFASFVGKMLPKTNARNREGAPAYAYEPRHALAQYAATGCLSGTFYADATEQLADILALCVKVDAAFIAKTAVFARERGFMKDTPALLCAILSQKGPSELKRIFPRVIDNGRMLRNFVQIVRSGSTGRKSLGTLPKKLVLAWLAERTDAQVFADSVGNDPSMADIVKMIHPKPATKAREALYGWLLGKKYDAKELPEPARSFEAYKRGETPVVPEVPFQMLTALNLGAKEWTAIAARASWQTTRMNLNTFARHGVFEVPGMTLALAKRLRDKEAIGKARAFPYQLMAAHANADAQVPYAVRDALHDAMEHALANVPAIDGRVFVFPDVSGSMKSPVTGARKGASSKVQCVDVAALVAVAILRKNRSAEILPFEDRVVRVELNPRDTVMTNAKVLATVGGGGTNCSAPLKQLNERGAKGDLVVYVSDNQSWVDATAQRGTETMREWQRFRARNPQAKMVCIDLQAYGTTQAPEGDGVVNVGGFSDQVFSYLAAVAGGRATPGYWVKEIEQIEL